MSLSVNDAITVKLDIQFAVAQGESQFVDIVNVFMAKQS